MSIKVIAFDTGPEVHPWRSTARLTAYCIPVGIGAALVGTAVSTVTGLPAAGWVSGGVLAVAAGVLADRLVSTDG